MPENQNQEQQHREDVNSYSYNPNRPNTPPNNANQTGNNSTEQGEHADTKKVVDTAAKGAAEAFAPGVGGAVYDTAKKVPGVGGAIDKATGAAAEALDQVPGVKDVAKGLNDSGATDAVNQGISLMGGKGGAKPGANQAKAGAPSSANSTPNMPGRKNSAMQSRISSGDALENASGPENTQAPDENNLDEETNDGGMSLPPSDLPPDDLEDNQEDDSKQNGDGKAEGKTDILSSMFKNFWDKHKFAIILGGGGGIFFFLIILVVLMGGSLEEENGAMGYMDAACNYNETEVTLISCESDGELSTYSLEDFVINMAYAYTRDGEYSDEAIKALMITLKTNALSYGNYNSSSKEVDVRLCDVFDGEGEDAESELWMFEGVDAEEASLSSLYDEISNYIYVSSSYTSTISNLSSRNVLEFDSSVFAEFQTLASNGNTYSQILNAMYNTSVDDSDDEETEEYRDTLFLGDSRTAGMQNAGVINDNNSVYGTGYGYNWLVGNGTFTGDTNSPSGGVAGINALMNDNTSYNIVIWLGVNDYENVNNYYNAYVDLATNEWSNHHIYIVSVGPVDDDLSENVKNSDIENFNQTMQNLINGSGLDNLHYIDLGYTEEDINTYDNSMGVHYGSEDYRAIYDIIMNSLDTTLSSSYQLYNLTSYCTYYTLTGNTAYWWPVGSSEATQGNIYGGAPVSTNITSYFGPRTDPITHEYSPGHGAIDIGVSRGTPVIATRDGTISYVNTGCSEGDYGCGGSYGNYVTIQHDDEVLSLYAHLSEPLVSEGEEVVQGQIIGYSGNTGRSTGPHLHFEIRLNGTRVNPLDYVDPENPRPIASTGINIAGEEGDYQNMLCSSLLASGYSENATIGIMANVYHESGFIPTNLQNSYNNSLGYSDSEYTLAVDNGTYTNFVYDRAGYGLVQWTSSGRKERLYNYAQERNMSIGSFEMQFNFMLYELENYYANTYKYLNGNHSAVEIGAYWCDHFESPSGSEPCSVYGNCPSSHCVSRTEGDIEALDLTTYVQNGCSY